MCTARPLQCCAALLLSLCQTLLNPSKPGDFLFHLFNFVCNQIPHVRTSARFAFLDQQQLPDFLERKTETLRPTDELQPIDGAFVVDPISCVGALSRRYEAPLLVEASTLSPVLWATLPICIDYSLIISIKSGVYSRVKRADMNRRSEKRHWTNPFGAKRLSLSQQSRNVSVLDGISALGRTLRGSGWPCQSGHIHSAFWSSCRSRFSPSFDSPCIWSTIVSNKWFLVPSLTPARVM